MLSLRAESDDSTNENQYDYSPTLTAGVIFVIAFSILSIIHLGILVKSRIWWTSVTLIGGLGELLGWVGRVWSAKNDTNHQAFILQIVLLVIVPSFFSAACYGVTGMLIRVVGPEFSLLGPSWFLRVFCTVDFISILIQVLGGAMASSDNPDTSNNGTHVMLGGIIFQLIAMLVFAAVALHFYFRARATLLGRAPFAHDFHAVRGVDALTAKPVRVLVWSLALASLAIVIRGIYRTVELAQGWHGYLMSREVFFDVFDAVPMVFCMAFLAPAHPYFGLPNHGKPIDNSARAFADDATVTEMASTGPAASKYSTQSQHSPTF